MEKNTTASIYDIIIMLIYFPIHWIVFLYSAIVADELGALVYGTYSSNIDADTALFTISCTAVILYIFLLIVKFLTKKLSNSKIEISYATLLVFLVAEIFGAWVFNGCYFSSSLTGVFACTNLFLICLFCITLVLVKLCEMVKAKGNTKWLTFLPFLIALTLGSVLNVGIYFAFRYALLGR